MKHQGFCLRATAWLFLLIATCLAVPSITCAQSRVPDASQSENEAQPNIAVIENKDFESRKAFSPSQHQHGESKEGSSTTGNDVDFSSTKNPFIETVNPTEGNLPFQPSETLPSEIESVSSENRDQDSTAKDRDTEALPQKTASLQTDGGKAETGNSETLSIDEPLSEKASETEADSQETIWSLDGITDRKSFPTRVKMFISLAAISLVPAILLMTTCFVRIVVVLGILRQAIGLQQLPPTQVMTALALIMTFLVMTPTWKTVKEEAIDPYSAEGSEMTWDEAWEAGTTPIKKFMWRQIQHAENEKDFWLFYDYLPEEEQSENIQSFEEIPLKVMMPAFLISELKVAFLIGVQIYLPFLILDIVVASFSNTMGLLMLPPTVASLPLKLILFVLVDGWNLVVAMLLNSFVPIT